MNKYALFLGALIIFSAQAAWSQVTVSGKVFDAALNEPLAGVNIIVKGKVLGTVTDANGNFSLTVSENPPITLSFSFIGFETQELEITENNVSDLVVNLSEQSILGQEIVVSASRVEETILESPVSIEKMDILAIQNTASDNYYKAIANLKGVDVATSSINFQIINARGFASTGNTRFVQLIDGMDTQAPALNFPIGNLNGPSELDVESVELIPGASSALYGPNAFNGILLINSKSPFEYQGLSAMAKLGVNHVGNDYGVNPSPMYEASVRYAKAYNNKFAFKVNFSYMRAEDWHGTSTVDRRAELNPFPDKENIGADRLHYMGDEASLNLNILRFSRTTDPADPGWQTLGSSGAGVFAPGQTAWQFAQSGFLPNHVISAPAYKESNIVDYGAENLKFNTGLYYRLNDQMELSYLFNGGYGTSVYTGAQRYSLANFSIAQHRLQLRGDNFFIRGYTTRENSGDSYIAEFLAKKINDVRFGGNVSNYLTRYPLYYLEHLYNLGYRKESDPNSVTNDEKWAAHEYAMSTMNSLYPLDEETANFEEIKESQISGTVPQGPKFDDKSNLYHVEGQYDFKNNFDALDLQVGASYRIFELNSNGTIFDDQGGLAISEYGAYAQASKKVLSDNLKLTGSLRYDKNENFDGQFSPRIAAVLTVADNHNFRGSFQTGFRNPTTQGQYIDLDVLTARLLGGLPRFAEKYRITENAYTGLSVLNYTSQIFATNSSPFDPANIALLEPFTTFDPVKPEKVKSIEVGYKSLIANKLMVDMAYYYNIYNDFITQIQIRKASLFTAADAPDPSLVGTPNYASLLNGTTLTLEDDGTLSGNTAQIYTNYDQEVSSQGFAIGLTYSLPRNFMLIGNYTWSKLNDQLVGGLSEFNTPEHKYNISFGNRKLTDKLGFNITYRWQESFIWESSFARGPVPSYSTIDAQVSYKLDDLNSIIKLGGSNLTNDYYLQSLGGPNIGAIYYISLTFDELMN